MAINNGDQNEPPYLEQHTSKYQCKDVLVYASCLLAAV